MSKEIKDHEDKDIKGIESMLTLARSAMMEVGVFHEIIN
jgi:hypothetical protein